MPSRVRSNSFYCGPGVEASALCGGPRLGGAAAEVFSWKGGMNVATIFLPRGMKGSRGEKGRCGVLGISTECPPSVQNSRESAATCKRRLLPLGDPSRRRSQATHPERNFARVDTEELAQEPDINFHGCFKVRCPDPLPRRAVLDAHTAKAGYEK